MIHQKIKQEKIIAEFSSRDSKISTCSVQEIKPQNWMGKNWACMEGFKKATGDIMSIYRCRYKI